MKSSNAVIIKIISPVVGGPSDLDGLWLKSYDPDGRGGRGNVIGTKKRAEALRFTDMPSAMKFWRQPSSVLPLRPDGKPNRPLTAFNIEVERE
jgi:hypothetical protein